jgi:integrase
MGKGLYEKTKYPGIFKYVGKNGEKYGIDYYSGGKKCREIIGPRLGEAQTELANKRALSKAGESLAGRKKITFKQFSEKYEEIEKGGTYFDKTRKYYIPVMRDFFNGKKLYQLSALDIQEYQKARKATPTKWGGERSDVAVNRELETLRHMLNKAVEWGMLTNNPFSKFKDSIFYEEDDSRIRYLTEEEIKKLFEFLDRKPKCRRKGKENAPLPYAHLKNIVMAALLTGLRRGDILRLKWADVDLDKGILFFFEQKKGNKRKIKILNSDMINLLKSIPKGESEFIFNGRDGQPLKDVKRSFKTALKKAGIRDFHFHDLRHTSASYMVMKGASLKSVQEHLGHTSLTMTQKYAHLSPEFQRAEVEKLSGLFTGGLANSKNLVRRGKTPQFPSESGAYATA